ncbi:hypothetical protein CYMTET_49712 [Cymbomonas tetramitiformis]|uniref:Nucleotide-diphospho-sugar transferase domain-containing protein n=1 Tax=Cymbomonas tetramitiformis TaxID=36881 RepID=A0AAE0BPP1_9CHLO|nr:hypothetical protein CYMTET_49712 [Cymbomonas tetramitiformis]
MSASALRLRIIRFLPLLLFGFPYDQVHGTDRHYFGSIDTTPELIKAVESAGLDGSITLVAVDGRSSAKHLVTALNTISNLRRYRVDNVVLLTASEQDCKFIYGQHVIPVRVCTWSNQLSNKTDWWLKDDRSRQATRIWFLRLMFLDLIMQAKEQVTVLMVDTDICFTENPFPYLKSLNHDVIFNGMPEVVLCYHVSLNAGINLGAIYASKSASSKSDAFGVLTEITRRMAALRISGINSTRVSGSVNGQLLWDQNIVNDVLHSWVSGKKMYFRSCWLGFGAKKDNTTCFSECCNTDHPFGLRYQP